MSHLNSDGIRRSDRQHPSSLSHQSTTNHIQPIPTTTIPTANDNLPSSTTPDILTPANFETTLQDDPDLSYQSSHHPSDPPESIDGSSATYRTPSPSTINRIESSINQLSTRLNSIELTHNTKIQQIEQQILTSQELFQSQLLQSQLAIKDMIQTTLSNIQQPSVPPPTSFQPPPIPPKPNSSQPSTQQHSDPPTTQTSQPPILCKPTSPDPPESTNNPIHHNVIKNPYKTPQTTHNHIQQIRPSPLPPPELPSQYATTPPSHQHSTNTTTQPTIIVQAPTHIPKLLIDSYKPKNGYNHFKRMTMLSLSADQHYSDLVRVGADGSLEFNPQMDDKQSKSLFCATLKALGPNALEAINTNTTDSNALHLWKSLDNHFRRSTSSHILKQKLKQDYEKLRKASTESFSAYVSKFENHLEILYHNEINPGSNSDIAYQFLASLSLPKVFNQILMGLDSTSEWALGHDLRALSYKAEDHFLKYEQIYSSSCPSPSPSPSPRPPSRPSPSPPSQPTRPQPTRPQPTRPRNHNPSPTPAPSPPQSSTPPPRPNPTYQRNETEIQHIREAIQASSNPTAFFHRLHRDQPTTCSLHSHAPHPIISCALLRNVCNHTNTFDILNNARNDLNMPPMPPTGLLLLPPRTRPSSSTPPPGFQQIPNPYLRQTPNPSAPLPPPVVPARHVTTNTPSSSDHPDPFLPTTDSLPFPQHHPTDTDFDSSMFAPIPFQVDETNTNNEQVNEYPILPPSILRSPCHPRSTLRVHFAQGTVFHTSSPIVCRYVPHADSTLPPLHALTTNHSSFIRAVCDSGASHTMSSSLSLFDSITYFEDPHRRPTAMMGDDSTVLPIHGYGYLNFTVHGHRIRLFSYFVPALGTTLISIKQHMRNKGCYFHAEAQQTLLAFPTFTISPRVAEEIDLLVRPASTSSTTFSFNEATATSVNVSQPSSCSTHQSAKLPSLHLRLISSSLPKYVSEPHLQLPLSHPVTVTRIAPQATLPVAVKANSGDFKLFPVCSHTILPGSSVSIPTGLTSSFPTSVSMVLSQPSSSSPRSLSITPIPTISPTSSELHVTVKNCSPNPLTIGPSTAFAVVSFTHLRSPLICMTPPPHTTNSPATSPMSSAIPSPHSHVDPSTATLTVHHGTSRTFHKARRISRPPLQPQFLRPGHLPTSSSLATLSTTNIDNSTNSTKMNHPPIDLSKHTSTPPFPGTPRTRLPVDSVNAALPKLVTMSRQSFLQSIGFRKPDKILKHMHELASNPISISRDSSPRIDPGEVATMASSRRNTSPSAPPANYSDVWHLDIGFGPCTAIGGIRYTLLAVDKHSRYKLVYGLSNLTTSLLKAIQQFITDCGVPPKLIRTDFDHKIMGGKVAAFLKSHQIPVEAAPPYRQHQNGLVESHWQTVVDMARNWITSSLLPSKYWYFAIKRACEVCNLLPTHHLSHISTPFTLVHKRKVDYRLLFPMFSTAFIKYRRHGGAHTSKWAPQSLKCIAVGTCSKSNGLLFYHPPSKQVITCGDGYKFDSFSPSGPQFNETFDGNFVFSTKSLGDAVHRPPSYELQSKVFYQSPDDPSLYLSASVLSQPVDDEHTPYTVQDSVSGNIVQLHINEIFDHDPSASPSQSSPTHPFPHLPWIRHEARVTLFLNDRMSTPKQGFLLCTDNVWCFHMGRKLSKPAPAFPLDNFDELAESLVHNKKLFQGWKTKAFVCNARHARAAANILSHHIFCRKVSASNLHSFQAPTLLNHSKLHPDDKLTWDAAYLSEYNGLTNINTWDTISESDYQSMKHLYKGILPTMAISTIKYDGDGRPSRAKYRIVALGNLDPHSWTKQDCFAPVLSQLELRFLTALAVKNKCIPKTGDVTQAFCQSCLPEDEHYICRPPPGCPLTPPQTYWKLKKTLYGLKRSPRHFYELARSILLSIGLTQHPTSPCIFSGTLIPGEPPIYLGLYVDDFFYFSKSDKVEKLFEERFGNKIDTDFNGQVGYFLGINFTCTKHDDGNVSIHLGQEAFIENLCQIASLDSERVIPVNTPYRSGCPVDTIPIPSTPPPNQHERTHTMQVLLGCLTWLSISTRPDISTITNILAQYTNTATSSHIDHVKRVIRYLKTTKSLGIAFHSDNNTTLQSYVKFPIPEGITAMCDANWGPQDQSKPRPNETRKLELFKTRSLSGFLIYLGGPMHWVSKRQTITARSSAEAEIYATDECTKCLLHIHQIVDGLNLSPHVMPLPTTIFNDNSACVNWSHNMTTKGLRHIQIRENSVRESTQSGFLLVKHCPGKRNLSDMFTKEDKDTAHFIEIRDVVMTDRNKLSHFASFSSVPA
jgi:hypothetical protein